MTGCRCYIIFTPPVKWLGYRGVESSRGGYELRSGFGPAWVRIQPTCQKEAALQKRARAAGSTVPDGSGPASCCNRVRLSPSCAVCLFVGIDAEKALSFGGDCINFVGGSMVHRPSILRRAQDRPGSGRTIAGGTPALRNLVRLVHPPN